MVAPGGWLASFLLVSCALPSLFSGAAALPPGKAWAPSTRFEIDGYASLSVPRLEFDGSVLRAETEPRGGGLPAALGLRWRDSLWVDCWRLGYPTYIFGPVVTLDGEAHLVWLGDTDPGWTRPPLMMSRWVGNALGPIDTVTRTLGVRTEYSAAVSHTRRWVVECERVIGSGGQEQGEELRLFYSDRAQPPKQGNTSLPKLLPYEEGFESALAWHEVRGASGGRDGVAIAPLGDSTAIVVWTSDAKKLEWGLLVGAQWVPKGQVPGVTGYPIRPRMRMNPDGGVWLSWGAIDPYAYLSFYDNGIWATPIRIGGVYPRDPQSNNFVDDTDMSRDAEPMPIVAWDSDYFASSQILIAFPEANGYSTGEFVSNSFDGVLPSVVRDQNGDAWLTWWQSYTASWWTHTYTHAIASDLRLLNHGRHRTLAWNLSEPAPGSWWTVLRSRNNEDEASVARVRAGDGTLVTWMDDSPPAGHLRYRIRRDCLDARFVWTSAEVTWPSPGGHAEMPGIEVTQRMAAPGMPLALRGLGIGTTTLEVFDLQGRRLLEQAVQGASESNAEVLVSSTELPVSTGTYFVRLRDAQGNRSAARRILVLK